MTLPAYRAHSCLMETAARLWHMVDAAGKLGFLNLAEQLAGHAADVESQADAMLEAYNEVSDSYVKAVGQGSANMLAAALAACELGKRD